MPHLQLNPILRQFTAPNIPIQSENDLKLNKKEKKTEYLEVDESKKVDFKNIVNDEGMKSYQKPAQVTKKKEKENSADFVDDPDVPPLI